MLISSLHFAVFFFFFWCGNTPHAHMLMGKTHMGSLIITLEWKEQVPLGDVICNRIQLCFDGFLRGFSFFLALYIISTQLPILWCYCSRDGTLHIITSTQSPTVWGYCTRDGTLLIITSTQSPTVWRRLRKPVSSFKCLCFLFKNVSS